MLNNTTDIEGTLCISTRDLNDQLPFVMQAKAMEEWGFTPHARIRAGLYWRVEDVPAILQHVIDDTLKVKENCK